MPKKKMSTSCTEAFYAAGEDLTLSAEEIMDYVEQEYHEFCAANGITLEKGTRVTA